MRVKQTTGFFVLFIVILPVLSFSEDQDLNVARIMRKIQVEVRSINTSLDDNDYYIAATHFMELAGLFKTLEQVTPEKGSKEEWDRIHNDIIKESFLAIGACALEDDDAISEHLSKIFSLQKRGHMLFR